MRGSCSDFYEYLKPCVGEAEEEEVLSFLLSDGVGEVMAQAVHGEDTEIVQRPKDRLELYREVRSFRVKLFLWPLKKKSGN